MSYGMCTSKLTHKHRETHGCVVSTVATDALVLKHQAISIHNADLTFIVLDQFHIKILHIRWTASQNEITFWKKWPSHLRVKGATLTALSHRRCCNIGETTFAEPEKTVIVTSFHCHIHALSQFSNYNKSLLSFLRKKTVVCYAWHLVL